jgi:hypothetical protein
VPGLKCQTCSRLFTDEHHAHCLVAIDVLPMRNSAFMPEIDTMSRLKTCDSANRTPKWRKEAAIGGMIAMIMTLVLSFWWGMNAQTSTTRGARVEVGRLVGIEYLDADEHKAIEAGRRCQSSRSKAF